MKEDFGYFVVNSILAGVFIALGCLFGLVSGAFASLSIATVIGWFVRQEELDAALLYFRSEYDYITIGMTILGGLVGLFIYLKKFIMYRKDDGPQDLR